MIQYTVTVRIVIRRRNIDATILVLVLSGGINKRTFIISYIVWIERKRIQNEVAINIRITSITCTIRIKIPLFLIWGELAIVGRIWNVIIVKIIRVCVATIGNPISISIITIGVIWTDILCICLLYTSPSPRDS